MLARFPPQSTRSYFKQLFTVLSVGALVSVGPTLAAQSDWAKIGAKNLLSYKSDPQGNHIMDFSSAGYEGGGVALPNVGAKSNVKPGSGGDDTQRLQDSIDRVSKLPLVNGFRGAVLLAPGIYRTKGALHIDSSGVVVRGSGSGINGTVIRAARVGAEAPDINSKDTAFKICGFGSRKPRHGAVPLSNVYIPSGAMSVKVEDVSPFVVGDSIVIKKFLTAEWIHSLGMDILNRLNTTTNIVAFQTWLKAKDSIVIDRNIVGIDVAEKRLFLDAPIPDNFDPALLASKFGNVTPYSFPGRIRHAGLEGLRIEAPAQDTFSFNSVFMAAAKDCWIRDLLIQDGIDNFILKNDVRRVTVDGVIVQHTLDTKISAAPASFAVGGGQGTTQILFNRCKSLRHVQTGTDGDWPWATQDHSPGPFVVLNFSTNQYRGIAPHQRWSPGILADGDTLPQATPSSWSWGIAFWNRGNTGTGHGWTTGWSVAWNVTAPSAYATNPPGAINWVIGGLTAPGKCKADPNSVDYEPCTPEHNPPGTFDQLGSMVEPKSLYLQQLYQRFALQGLGQGAQAIKNIGYAGAVTTNIEPDHPVGIGDRSSKASLRGLAQRGNKIVFELAQAGQVDVKLMGLDGRLLAKTSLAGTLGKNEWSLSEFGLVRSSSPTAILELRSDRSTQRSVVLLPAHL